MDLGPTHRLSRDVNFAVHGVVATVTSPGKAAITTTGVWGGIEAVDQPYGRSFGTREPRRLLSLRRDEAPDVPLHSVIVASEDLGGTPRNWQVDDVDETSRYTIRYLVIPKVD